MKPEFFRHEKLQDLESANKGKYPMLVFAGLWGHCDKSGRFEYRPRQLKLDILPFLDFDMAETLKILEGAGFISVYEVDGKQYGEVPSFGDHQRINGKEALEPARFPEKQSGSTGETTEITGREGKGREKEGNGYRGNGAKAPSTDRGSKFNLKALPDDWRVFCKEERPKLDPEKTFFQFMDHWAANANRPTAKKSDWFAAWRNWIRRERP